MKAMFIGLGVLGGLMVVGIGVWIYVVSNVEQPKYTIVIQDDIIEIRDYPALVVAEVTRRGDRNSAVRAGFGPLAGYIFAKSRDGEAISMTAPVTQTSAEAIEADTIDNVTVQVWFVRFIMPAKYTLETLPKSAGEDVRLLNIPSSRRAAIRFSGVATDGHIEVNESALRAWLDKRSIAIKSKPTYAYYNDPFTPGPLRRNEVLFDVLMP